MSSRAAIARLAALHVDDGAERALERAAAAGVERRQHAVIALDETARQIGDGLLLHIRQVVHVIVDRLRRAGMNVPKEGLEMLLRFAREEDDPEVDRLFEFRRQLLQHRHAAADMEAADGDRDASRAKLARDRHRARKLVRLNAGQTDEARMPRLIDAPRDALDRDLDVHLVVGVDLDRDTLRRAPCGARSPRRWRKCKPLNSMESRLSTTG